MFFSEISSISIRYSIFRHETSTDSFVRLSVCPSVYVCLLACLICSRILWLIPLLSVFQILSRPKWKKRCIEEAIKARLHICTTIKQLQGLSQLLCWVIISSAFPPTPTLSKEMVRKWTMMILCVDIEKKN